MTEKIRILFLSANPWTTSRILVDEEAREVFEKLQEGPYRDRFELHRHAAIRPIDLQRLLMMYEPHIVHFSGHGSKKQKIILGGTPGRGKQVDRDGLVQVFALYRNHVRLIVLNACFTRPQARSLSEVIDYSVGAGKGIGDKEGVAFAGAFYRALGFGRSVKAAFESAKAELALTGIPRTKGIDLIIRNGVDESDSFPKANRHLNSEAEHSGSDVSDPLTNDANGGDESGLHQKTNTERSRPEIALFETLATGASELTYKEECQDCDQNQDQVSSMQTEVAPALDLLRLSDNRSQSAGAGLRKTKRPKRAKATRGEKESYRRSSLSCVRSSVTLTVKVIKVAVSNCKCSK